MQQLYGIAMGHGTSSVRENGETRSNFERRKRRLDEAAWTMLGCYGRSSGPRFARKAPLYGERDQSSVRAGASAARRPAMPARRETPPGPARRSPAQPAAIALVDGCASRYRCRECAVD